MFVFTLQYKVLFKMKNEQDYLHDITEIRSMMERSTKFLSLSGWAGIMAGIYALAAVYIATSFLQFDIRAITAGASFNLFPVCMLASTVLILAVGTAIVLSNRNASTKGEKTWNATSRKVLATVAVPLFTGGFLILIFLARGLFEFTPALTLLFYGLALYSAGNFTFGEIKYLGLFQLILGLVSAWFTEYSIACWAMGFGILHIAYGIYIHTRYQQ